MPMPIYYTGLMHSQRDDVAVVQTVWIGLNCRRLLAELRDKITIIMRIEL